jgi:CheY-like chemotaxis protein/Ni2+-binding GTPase involved in maturation of urease and hydrogenase
MTDHEPPDASVPPLPGLVGPHSDPPDEREPAAEADTLVELLTRKIVGQPAALEFIAPYVQMYQAGLAPPDRPAGIFLLLGPTGTGKTRTVEALAEVLHGSPKAVLKIDCGEFQSDHEVAKLIGAPPGYLGHRETKPMLTQERLAGVTSSGCDLSLVLFDEVEKAAPSLTLLLLGILDKGTLNLGDNTPVSFERTLIFLTSNLGAREMSREVRPDIGFNPADRRTKAELAGKLETIGLGAVRKRFSPEFVNRIDVVITYQPLDAAAMARILDHHIEELQRHVHTRLGDRSFEIEVSAAAREALLGWLEAVLRGANLETISATTAAQAREAVANRRAEVALFDVVLPDGDGLALALELRTADPALQVILMTGTELSAEETDECERHDIPVLRKPFLGQDAISLIQARLVHARAARGSGR